MRSLGNGCLPAIMLGLLIGSFAQADEVPPDARPRVPVQDIGPIPEDVVGGGKKVRELLGRKSQIPSETFAPLAEDKPAPIVAPARASTAIAPSLTPSKVGYPYGYSPWQHPAYVQHPAYPQHPVYSQPPLSASISASPLAKPELLREAAWQLDGTAQVLERAGLFDRADQLRDLADQFRQESRKGGGSQDASDKEP